MVETILSTPFIKDILLPFLLVFAIVFAVLQKAEIFGKDKKQSDAIVALVVGLIVVGIGTATNVINNLLPILAIALVALLSFLLIWGFAYKEKSFDVPSPIKIVIGALAAIVVIITIVRFTPAWDYIKNLISGNGSSIIVNALFVILIIGAVLAVIFGSKSSESSSKSG